MHIIYAIFMFSFYRKTNDLIFEFMKSIYTFRPIFSNFMPILKNILSSYLNYQSQFLIMYMIMTISSVKMPLFSYAIHTDLFVLLQQLILMKTERDYRQNFATFCGVKTNLQNYLNHYLILQISC